MDWGTYRQKVLKSRKVTNTKSRSAHRLNELSGLIPEKFKSTMYAKVIRLQKCREEIKEFLSCNATVHHTQLEDENSCSAYLAKPQAHI